MPMRTVTPKPRRTMQDMGESQARVSRNRTIDELVIAIGKALDGKINSTAEVTLAVSPATTTVFSDPRILTTSAVFLTPTTATAAAALATTFVTAAQGSVTINHASDAAADRTFRLAVFA